MNVAVFSPKYYEPAFLKKYNTDYKHSLTYFDESLNVHTTDLWKGFDVACL
jgi:D-lactate dehydrogenase